MTDGRIELHNKLKQITQNVYYEPADGKRLSYPCIVYTRQNIDNKRANNSNLYVGHVIYNVQYMTTDGANTKTKEMLRLLPTASLSNIMVNDGVYHENYNIYYRL